MKNNYPIKSNMFLSGRGVGLSWFFIGFLAILWSPLANAQVVCDPELKFTIQSTPNSAEGVDDATIRVTGLDPTIDYVVQFGPTSSFTRNFASGVAYSTLADGVVADDLTNPPAAGTSYTVAVFVPDGSCYAEKTYVLPRTYFNDEPDNTDVEVTMGSSGPATEPGDIVTITVTVTNNNDPADNPGFNIVTATGVAITVSAPTGGEVTVSGTPTVSKGSFDGTIWTVGDLAPGETQTLTIQYVVNDRGIYEIAAEVTAQGGEPDIDSDPTVSSIIEDDMMTQCITTPFDYCRGDEFEFRLADPSRYANIRWIEKTGGGDVILSGSTARYEVHADGYLIIKATGVFTYEEITGDATACGYQACCPIEVVPGVEPDIAPIAPVSICYESPIADVVVIENTDPNNDSNGTSEYDIDRGILVYQWFTDGGTGAPITSADSMTGYTSLTLNFDALPAAPGTYVYQIIGMDETHQTCRDTADFVVVIQDIEKPIAATNAPICETETLSLYTDNMTDYDSGAPFTFAWDKLTASGSGNWSATGDSVTRAAAHPDMDDDYVLTVSVEYTNFTPAQTTTCTKYDTVAVVINPLPEIPDPIDYIYCQDVPDSEMDSLRLNNENPALYTITWYDHNGPTGDSTSVLATFPSTRPFPSSVDDGLQLWWVTHTNNVTGCESFRAVQQVQIDPKPEMPIVSNFAFCENRDSFDLTATALANHGLIWYGTDSTIVANIDTSATHAAPGTTTVGITKYFVSQYDLASQCQSYIAEFEVHILDTPQDLAFDIPEYCLDTDPSQIVSLDNHLTISSPSVSAPTPAISYNWDYPLNPDPAVAPTPTATAVGATYGTVEEIFTYTYNNPADNFNVNSIECVSDVLPVHVVINPKPTAEVIAISSLCVGETDVDNGTLILTRFAESDTLEWNVGTTYNTDPSSPNNYILEAPIQESVHGGVFASTLANPGAGNTRDYFVKITNRFGCEQDIPVTLDGKDCVCPGGYCEPATVTPNF